MPTLPLTGCAPAPLAHYLKALGILRLVAEQADPHAAGCWRRDDFVLHTALDAESLTAFFLKRYRPTPILSPWNGGSGFYFQEEKLPQRDPLTGKKIKTGIRNQATEATKTLDAIKLSLDDRFSEYREAISTTTRILSRRGLTASPKDEAKAELFNELRAYWPDSAIGWIDTLAILLPNRDSGTLKPTYTSLLGSGGNEGNGDFSSNFMQRLREALLDETPESVLRSRNWLHLALFGGGSPQLRKAALAGQYFPGSAGGVNSTAGFKGTSSINPWDYILLIEGSLLFASGAARKLGDSADAAASSPFCVKTSGIGYSSATLADQFADKSHTEELWAPLWPQPATFSELKLVFGEGRAHVSSVPATTGVDFARAVVSLGVDRGISSFQRYGFFARNGDLSFATPLEKLDVRSNSGANLLTEIDSWLRDLRIHGADKKAPASVRRAWRELDSTILKICRDENAQNFLLLVGAIGRTERSVSKSFRWATGKDRSPVSARIRPLPQLSPEWFLQLRSTGSPEARLAAALASIHSGALRAHLEPVEQPRGFWEWSVTPGNDVCWTEGGLQTVLLDILTRRLSAPEKAPSLHHDHAAFYASLDDIEAFIRGELDDDLIADLWWALSALDWRNVRATDRPFSDTPPSALFSLLRLCFPQPGELRHGSTTVPPVPAILAKARAGLSVEASKLAVRRLRASGFRPRLDSIEFGPAVTTRTAAALLFPLHPDDFSRLQASILRQDSEIQA
jgi:CRISPR-associated protein Csx17